MLITPERMFYAGLLGRPRARCAGFFNVYVAMDGGLTLSAKGVADQHDEILVVQPAIPHTVVGENRSVICIAAEPESVRANALEDLTHRLIGPERRVFARRIRAAYDRIGREICRRQVSNAELDILCFGEALPRRQIDGRIARAITRLERPFNGVSAESCAMDAGLSVSRFLHLFKDQTGSCFRFFRAWKRARQLLYFANQNLSLTHLAQDLGYPDSSHLSHSIRRFYGLKPSAIFVGSRDLAIYASSTDFGSSSGEWFAQPPGFGLPAQPLAQRVPARSASPLGPASSHKRVRQR
ncbi:MAG: helix-turn-helix transcriptional regulator [Methylobacteriaceae bacterium]|nr:helix-turn-helix transcriptional regulator [Methylobacteriaceae bacterium]